MGFEATAEAVATAIPARLGRGVEPVAEALAGHRPTSRREVSRVVGAL